MEAVHIFMRLSPHSTGLLTVKLTALNPTTTLPSHYYVISYRLMIQLLLIRYTVMNLRFGIKLTGERMPAIHFDSVKCGRDKGILEFSALSVASRFSSLLTVAKVERF